MAPVFRKFTKRVFIVINIVLCSLFLLACCNAFLQPQKWWFVALLGLSFPFLLILVAAFTVFWIIFRSKWALLSLTTLVLGYTNIRALVGFHYGKEIQKYKPEGSLRILTWNVSWFDEQLKADKSRLSYRGKMLEFIDEHKPDVLCFQEYFEPHHKRYPYSNKTDFARLGYPYSIIAYDYTGFKSHWQTGVAIYSKYPIIDSVHIRYPGPLAYRAAESLIGADINFNGSPIRIFTTHLQSVLFKDNDYRNIEIIKTGSDSVLEASKSLALKLARGYRFRSQQVEIVRNEVDSSPHPVVICGDFNDVPNSYTYFRIKGDRKDAFTQAGKGIGRTFSNIAPTLRIDYIMTDKRFDVQQYIRYFVPYSEHYPVIADLTLTR
ncbi:MAG: endonuclease/exonuclease/phosphatase family protein [Chitinophagaceae bacterium]|nr:endonuclease/exonuclease/phosphatase family protein [Chitinophagaceae bacterium]